MHSIQNPNIYFNQVKKKIKRYSRSILDENDDEPVDKITATLSIPQKFKKIFELDSESVNTLILEKSNFIKIEN